MAVLVAVIVSGCSLARPAAGRSARYVPPSREAPHAEVRFRVRHHARLGDMFGDAIEIDGRRALAANDHDGDASGTIRVRAGEHVVRVSTVAFDEAARTGIAYTRVATQYRCGCRDRRWCTTWVPVPYLYETADLASAASCEAGLQFRARAGSRYAIDYDVWTDGRCEARCRRLDGDAACD
jgi:hypothetical protein